MLSAKQYVLGVREKEDKLKQQNRIYASVLSGYTYNKLPTNDKRWGINGKAVSAKSAVSTPMYSFVESPFWKNRFAKPLSPGNVSNETSDSVIVGSTSTRPSVSGIPTSVTQLAGPMSTKKTIELLRIKLQKEMNELNGNFDNQEKLEEQEEGDEKAVRVATKDFNNNVVVDDGFTPYLPPEPLQSLVGTSSKIQTRLSPLPLIPSDWTKGVVSTGTLGEISKVSSKSSVDMHDLISQRLREHLLEQRGANGSQLSLVTAPSTTASAMSRIGDMTHVNVINNIGSSFDDSKALHISTGYKSKKAIRDFELIDSPASYSKTIKEIVRKKEAQSWLELEYDYNYHKTFKPKTKLTQKLFQTNDEKMRTNTQKGLFGIEMVNDKSDYTPDSCVFYCDQKGKTNPHWQNQEAKGKYRKKKDLLYYN